MPYLYETHEGEEIAKVNRSFCGPQFDDANVEKAVKLEVWGSSCNDPGPDWCRFDLIDSEGERITTRTTPGY